MNHFSKYFLSFGLCISSITMLTTLDAKGGLFKKLFKVFTASPIKVITQAVAGRKPLIPTSVQDFQQDIWDNFDVVEKGKLYRSGQLSSSALDNYMTKYGIKTVLNLRGEHPEADWWRKEKNIVDRHNGLLVNIPLNADTLTSKDHLRKILEVFDKAPKPILVHCRAGVDRTGEVCALWVLDQQHKSTSTALEQLSLKYRHFQKRHPAKSFLIRIWQGRDWFENAYDPRNYPQFRTDGVANESAN